MHLTPSQTARRFGVSIKALRLYESRGLLKPLRSDSGWRTYGPDQIARLHQILTLKRLGLPLARIGQILASSGALDTVLAVQEQALERDSENLAHALGLVRAARARLKAGETLSIDDLATLTKETVMTRIVGAKEMNQLFTPFSDRHISPEEKETLKHSIDREQFKRTFDGLIAEGETLLQAGDPASPSAQDWARRWAAMAKQISAAVDPTVTAKSQAVWNDAMEDPVVAGRMALNRKTFAFVDQAIAHLKTVEK